MSTTARKTALNDKAQEKRDAKKTDLTASPAAASKSIASFFKPKSAAAEVKDVEMADETSRDSAAASAPADTPVKEADKVSPDTQKVGRKRIKRVESSDDEDNAPEEPPSKDPARASSPAAEPAASESSAVPEKSPVKLQVTKSAASFFTKKTPEADAPAAKKASDEEKAGKTAAAKEVKEAKEEPHGHSSPAKAQTPAKAGASFFGAAAPKPSRLPPSLFESGDFVVRQFQGFGVWG